ncbi:hypothetical protein N7447_008973 [Penicillium robsamsonii]|uniref:uncharacterized protein n=1 Tax=Penicillium robsamsonii TaxID=1792511 RepID=UPI00254659F7|nr:uncharacterized protein N7447_008973 [Penicillium robsamsonii]KAJ5816740.1 hypothetical protein N7447_008973 [Penicillium robsamsonii]
MPASYSRMAPPVRPSRSLEGLERVIPPLSPLPPLSPNTFATRSDLFLNKPLPAEPLPEQPEYSAIWSDSSDSESTLDSITVSSEPRSSADSYPIFVSSGSEFDDLVDHPTPSDQLELSPQSHKRTHSIAINIPTVEPSSVSSSFSDTPYGRPSNWIPNRTGTNHYFREKKWDYFPELAPSALQAGGRLSPNMVARSKTRKMGNPLEFAKGKCRWHSLDRGGFGGVRNSIKTYVHRTLSRDSTENKPKDIPRPATAPMDHHLNDVGGALASTAPAPQQSFLALNTNVERATSVATSSSTEYDYTNHKFHLQTPISPTSPTSISSPTTPRPKQLAVPLSAYQKHGSVIWESPKKSKRNVQFPRYKCPSGSLEPSSSTPDLSRVNAIPTSSPLRKQSQNNTRGVFLGAKKKIAESKDDRRREQLKAQIKFVGPVNPYTCAQTDPWI